MKPTNSKRADAFVFFLTNAGYSQVPGESKTEGQERCAKQLERAEYAAWDGGYTFEWTPDAIDSSDFSDEEPPWQLWVCCMFDAQHKAVQSLGGIDFGRDVEPWGQAYKRVVEAELALQELDT